VKLNWAEGLAVNNPVRVMIQRLIVKWIKGVTRMRHRALAEAGFGLKGRLEQKILSLLAVAVKGDLL